MMGPNRYRYTLQIDSKIKLACFFMATDDETAKHFAIQDAQYLAETRFSKRNVKLIALKRTSGLIPKQIELGGLTSKFLGPSLTPTMPSIQSGDSSLG